MMTIRVNIFPTQYCNAKDARPIIVLIDTGSQRNFIDHRIAKEMKLRTTDKKEFAMRSFHGHRKEYNANIVELFFDTWRGAERVEFAAVDPFAGPTHQVNPNLKYLKTKDKIAAEDTTAVVPELLLGISDCWKFNLKCVNNLPSGFSVIDSDIGRFITGSGRIEAYACECHKERTELALEPSLINSSIA
jgi:hypothetical protein